MKISKSINLIFSIIVLILILCIFRNPSYAMDEESMGESVVKILKYTSKPSITGAKVEMEGIEGTIYYYFEVLGHEPNNIYLLGKVIRDEYEHARTYMEERKRIMEANKDVEIDVPPVTYKIDRPKGNRKIKYRMEDL